MDGSGSIPSCTVVSASGVQTPLPNPLVSFQMSWASWYHHRLHSQQWYQQHPQHQGRSAPLHTNPNGDSSVTIDPSSTVVAVPFVADTNQNLHYILAGQYYTTTAIPRKLYLYTCILKKKELRKISTLQ